MRRWNRRDAKQFVIRPVVAGKRSKRYALIREAAGELFKAVLPVRQSAQCANNYEFRFKCGFFQI